MVPFSFCLSTVGVSLLVPEVFPEDYRWGADHIYAWPAVALAAATHVTECQTENIDSIPLIKAVEVTNQQQAATVLRLENEISKLKEELLIFFSFFFFFFFFSSADSMLPSDEAVQFYTFLQTEVYMNRYFSAFLPKRTRCIIDVVKVKTTTKQRLTKGNSAARQKRWSLWECWLAWKWACSLTCY